MNVYFLMCNIIITAKNNIRALLPQALYIIIKFIKPLVFIGLSFLTCSTRWEISIDQTNRSKIKLYHAALRITHLVTGTTLHIIGLDLCKNRNATVSFFLGAKPV